MKRIKLFEQYVLEKKYNKKLNEGEDIKSKFFEAFDEIDDEFDDFGLKKIEEELLEQVKIKNLDLDEDFEDYDDEKLKLEKFFTDNFDEDILEEVFGGKFKNGLDSDLDEDPDEVV